MTVALLVDNDIVIKLAQMDAYAHGMAGLGVQAHEVGSMPVMLRYMGVSDPHRRARLTANQAEADRLLSVLQSIAAVEMTGGETAVAARVMKMVLAAGLDVDEGELALCVVAVCRGQIDVCTGDKRALREMPALAAVWDALVALRERFVCLEQVFERLCANRGIARVGAAVTTAPHADTTITYAYEHTRKSGDKAFIQGMKLVIREHVEKPAPGWLKPI